MLQQPESLNTVEANPMDDYNDEETLEECKARLRKISEEIKDELKAGTLGKPKFNHSTMPYGGTVTGRITYPPRGLRPQFKEIPREEMYFDYDVEVYPPVSEQAEFRQAIHKLVRGYAKTKYLMFDECHHIKPQDYWLAYGTPKEKDWDRKTFKSGGSTAPSDGVRAKLRAKRKAKKK